MADMLSFDTLQIKSQVSNYHVLFVDKVWTYINEELTSGSFFIIDELVFSIYREYFKDIIHQNRYLIVKATEENKSIDYVKVVIKYLINHNIKKNNKLVGIGGGIIQDITGFISSILFRGISWDFYPTTLLAQCDSCIGSKTSINIDEFKNQIGTFFPPCRIILGTKFLETLNETDIRSGLGEIIKLHLIDGEDSLKYIFTNFDKVFIDKSILKEFIYRSLLIKKTFIEQDEFDRDLRNILNYGHTFGHAIESVNSYAVSHGNAVTIGMGLANFISLQLGLLSNELYTEMDKIINKNIFNIKFDNSSLELFLKALLKDKKNIGDKLTAILTRGPGKMEKVQLSIDNNFKKYIADYFFNHKVLTL
jgi:3-dehydroquinate synthase